VKYVRAYLREEVREINYLQEIADKLKSFEEVESLILAQIERWRHA
jgi:hypothetical protein